MLILSNLEAVHCRPSKKSADSSVAILATRHMYIYVRKSTFSFHESHSQHHRIKAFSRRPDDTRNGSTPDDGNTSMTSATYI